MLWPLLCSCHVSRLQVMQEVLESSGRQALQQLPQARLAAPMQRRHSQVDCFFMPSLNSLGPQARAEGTVEAT